MTTPRRWSGAGPADMWCLQWRPAGKPGAGCGYPSSGPGWPGFCQWTNKLWRGLLVLSAPGMVKSVVLLNVYLWNFL